MVAVSGGESSCWGGDATLSYSCAIKERRKNSFTSQQEVTSARESIQLLRAPLVLVLALALVLVLVLVGLVQQQ
jgi:hypothetical protein